MPGGPAGPYVFSKFIEGYMQGARQTQMDRITKASNLMQVAQMRAKEIDEADTQEGRALAWKNVKETMDEAEKLMKGSDGLWKTITGIFGGKKKKQELEDPAQLFGQFGMQNIQVPVGGGEGQGGQPPGAGLSSSFVQPTNPDGTPRQGLPYAMYAQGGAPITNPNDPNLPPKVDSFPDRRTEEQRRVAESAAKINTDNVSYEPNKVPSVLGGPQPEGPPAPPETQAQQEQEQKRLAGIEQSVWGPGGPTEGAAPKEVTLPPPRIPMMNVPVPKAEELPKGIVSPEQAKGKGLEMVRVAPGRTEYHINGRSVTAGEYKQLERQVVLKEMELEWSKTMSAEQLKHAMDLQKQKFELEDRRGMQQSNAYVLSLPEGVPIDEDIYNELRFGIKGRTPKTRTVTGQDANGQRFSAVVDLESGKELAGSRFEEPPTKEDMEVLGIQQTEKNPDGSPLTWSQAQAKRWADIAEDRTLQHRLRTEQLRNLGLSADNKKRLADIRAKGNGITKSDVFKALNYLRPQVTKAVSQPYMRPDGTYNPDGGKIDLDKYNALMHQQLSQELGLPWEKIIEIFGGNPLAAQEGAEDAAKAYARGAGSAQAGGTTVYQPPK